MSHFHFDLMGATVKRLGKVPQVGTVVGAFISKGGDATLLVQQTHGHLAQWIATQCWVFEDGD